MTIVPFDFSCHSIYLPVARGLCQLNIQHFKSPYCSTNMAQVTIRSIAVGRDIFQNSQWNPLRGRRWSRAAKTTTHCCESSLTAATLGTDWPVCCWNLSEVKRRRHTKINKGFTVLSIDQWCSLECMLQSWPYKIYTHKILEYVFILFVNTIHKKKNTSVFIFFPIRE